jgi:hypothetical protein
MIARIFIFSRFDCHHVSQTNPTILLLEYTQNRDSNEAGSDRDDRQYYQDLNQGEAGFRR